MRASPFLFVALMLWFATQSGCHSKASSSHVASAPANNGSAQPNVATSPQTITADTPLRLGNIFVPLEASLALRIDPAASGYSGASVLRGRLLGPTRQVTLHGEKLTIRAASVAKRTASGSFASPQPATVTAHSDRLSVRFADEQVGEIELKLEFEASYEMKDTVGTFKQVVAAESYVYTQFEATYARRAFPCFDEPSTKIPWQVTLTVPASYTAVANSRPVTTSTNSGWLTTTFATTKPLPSYLVAFAVGHFEVTDAGMTKHGVPLRVIAPKGSGSKVEFAAQTTKRVVDILEDWFSRPYPYDKLDMLAVPITVGFGAMENAGLITFTESRLLIESPRSLRAERKWIALAAHEIAHQWFGNLVTMQWWDDIWLNEGFASWMEYKVLAEYDPRWRSEVGLAAELEEALTADGLTSARKIREPIVEAGDINNAFDGITYLKGQSLLSMLEATITPAVMQKAVRSYLSKHAYANASSGDFIAAINATTGQDFTVLLERFLNQVGAPLITATVRCEASKATVQVSQSRFDVSGKSVPSDPPWHLPVCLAYGSNTTREVTCIALTTAQSEVALRGTCPTWLLANANASGYYRTDLTAADAAQLAAVAWPRLTLLEKHYVASNTATAVTVGKLPVTTSLAIAERLFTEEHYELIELGTAILDELRQFVADSDRPLWDSWVVTMTGPAATKLGWQRKPNESIHAEIARKEIVPLAALAGEASLRNQAVRLAVGWKQLPPAIRGAVLTVAVTASELVRITVFQLLPSEGKRELRSQIIDALAALPQTDAFGKALDFILDSRLDVRETDELLFAADSAAKQTLVENFYVANEKAILARAPSETTTGSAVKYAAIFTKACSAQRRDQVVALVHNKFDQFLGAKRELTQMIEEMDQCIATKAKIAPQLLAFLKARKSR